MIKSNLEEYLETAPDIIYTNDNESCSEPDDATQSQEIKGSVVKTVIVSSPITGVAADLSTAPDEAFADSDDG